MSLKKAVMISYINIVIYEKDIFLCNAMVQYTKFLSIVICFIFLEIETSDMV